MYNVINRMCMYTNILCVDRCSCYMSQIRMDKILQIEKLIPRSYHLLDYDWTPLSRNPCWLIFISFCDVWSFANTKCELFLYFVQRTPRRADPKHLLIHLGGRLSWPFNIFSMLVFPKIGVPQNGWFIMKTLLELGYPCFWKHPCIVCDKLLWFQNLK